MDKDGTPDNNEQYWISCGDIEGQGRHSRAIYNDVINNNQVHLKEFIDLGKAVTDRFLEIFSAVLAISPESKDFLTKLYSHTNNSGTHVRLLKCPPKPENAQVNLQPQYVPTAPSLKFRSTYVLDGGSELEIILINREVVDRLIRCYLH